MLEISEEKCTGCALCAALCPNQAITFAEFNGFRYPKVNQDHCVNCKLCMRKCPALNKEIISTQYPTVYAAWSKDVKQRAECTSGGICYEMSKYVIEQGGYVAGVAWKEDLKNAEYRLIKSLGELSEITQTKYFQPDMRNIFFEIRNTLREGGWVLFIGSSCTNAALRSYVGEHLLDKLICCDFICRGYTSQIYHQKRVEYLEAKHHSRIKHIQYKNKSRGWNKFGTVFIFQNGDTEYINRYEDPYEIMFQIDDYNTRPSCFDCKYRDIPRLTDITVGDFWAVKKLDEDILYNGVSAVLINSDKGRELFEHISKNLEYEERNLWEVSRGNYALLHQLRRKQGESQFFEDLSEKGIPYIHKKYGKNKVLMKIMHKTKILLSFFSRCNLILFVYYNFCCKNVKRDKRCYLVPCRGARLHVEKNASIVLHSSLYINVMKHKHSREESYLHIYNGGRLEVKGRVRIAADNTIDVLANAVLVMGETETNYGTVIVCSNNIVMGDGTDIGRNVRIYDSNYHPTGLNKSQRGKPLIIEDHVWLCSGVSIVKGIRIGAGAICGINSTVTKSIKSRHMVLGNPAKDIMADVEW